VGHPLRPPPVTVGVDLEEDRRAVADEEVERTEAERHRGSEQASGRDYRGRGIHRPDPDPLRVGPRVGGGSLVDFERRNPPGRVIHPQLRVVLDVFLHHDRGTGIARKIAPLDHGGEDSGQPTRFGLDKMLVHGLDDQPRAAESPAGVAEVGGDDRPRYGYLIALGEHQLREEGRPPRQNRCSGNRR
jgi:hypothetical protein